MDPWILSSSRKKAEALKAEPAKRGVAAERIAKLKAPAGLDLGGAGRKK
jgi:xanthine/CO dehydrogenase XdhC/CoxF family maturation factor